VVVERGVQALEHAGAEVGAALGQALALHEVQVGQRHRARGGVAAEGVDVAQAVGGVAVAEGVQQLGRDRRGGERQIAARDALGHRDDVRAHAVALVAEPAARAAKPQMTSSTMSSTPWRAQASATAGR
jgi:hypothetical protein